MPSAARILIFASGAVALLGCHKQPPKTAQNDDLSIESNIASNQLPPNAELETLPSDESSTTSNSELAAGDDKADANGVAAKPKSP